MIDGDGSIPSGVMMVEVVYLLLGISPASV
jgi:hypothetical protein